jgi:dihydrofolate reductase
LLLGGGKVVSQFLDAGLINEIDQFLVPVILKDGIPLYTGIRQEISLNLVDAKAYSTGIVRLRYLPQEYR